MPAPAPRARGGPTPPARFVPWRWLTVLAAGWFLAARALAGIPATRLGIRVGRDPLGLGAVILTLPRPTWTSPRGELQGGGPHHVMVSTKRWGAITARTGD
jgi:hypothetical protein